MDYQDIINMCTHETPDFKIPVNTIKRCFGMSKMTNREAANSRAIETRLYFVEFLEFIGRIAVEYWEYYPDMVDITLAQKIEFVIDQFLLIIDLERNEVINPILSESESDDDY